MIISQIKEHQQVVNDLLEQCVPTIEKIIELCKGAVVTGHTIFLCGNGGSAADSQHIAAEFVGRFLKEREGLPAIALTTDTSILTAVGNDYGFDKVFSRQVEALGKPGDILIGISTSGNSRNVIAAFEKAKVKQMKTIAFTGNKSSESEKIADVTLKIPSAITARIQECHILVGHIVCNAIDELVVQNLKTIKSC